MRSDEFVLLEATMPAISDRRHAALRDTLEQLAVAELLAEPVRLHTTTTHGDQGWLVTKSTESGSLAFRSDEGRVLDYGAFVRFLEEANIRYDRLPVVFDVDASEDGGATWKARPKEEGFCPSVVYHVRAIDEGRTWERVEPPVFIAADLVRRSRPAPAHLPLHTPPICPAMAPHTSHTCAASCDRPFGRRSCSRCTPGTPRRAPS